MSDEASPTPKAAKKKRAAKKQARKTKKAAGDVSNAKGNPKNRFLIHFVFKRKWSKHRAEREEELHKSESG
jgi:hypothetical protein